jgi:hypothetical protein
VIHVTDHALLRYLERVHGVDIEVFRAALRATVGEAAIAAGAAIGGSYAVKAGRHAYICQGETVITVVPRCAATTSIGGTR